MVASADAEVLVTAKAKPLIKTAVPAKANSPGKATEYVVQIGALPSRQEAMRILLDTQAKHGDILNGFEPVAEPYKSVVRARYSGFGDRQAAKDICDRLRKKRVTCQVLPL
jgi:D-alanyl-D-alanine carboxypeptidase